MTPQRCVSTALGALVIMLLATSCASPPEASAPSASGAPEEQHDMEMGAPSFGSPGSPADADRSVRIETTDDLRFQPDSVQVAAGETITFDVVNTSAIEHEFVLGDDATQLSHAEEMTQMEGTMMMDEPNAVLVPSGETKTLTWTFSEPGDVTFACHVSGHYEAGMKGNVGVSAD